MNGRQGFTLMELMVVLALFALTAAAALPAFGDATRTTPARRTATEIARILTAGRDMARQRGVPVAVVVSPSTGAYWVGDSAPGQLPLRDASIASASPRIECRFAPTGPATPCTFVVSGGETVIVRTGIWSGEIRIDDGTP